jgi:hypothetical protein
MRPATHARHHEAVDGSGLDERGRPVVFEVIPAPPAPTHRLRTVGGIVAVVLVGAAVLGGTIALAAPAGPAGGPAPALVHPARADHPDRHVGGPDTFAHDHLDQQ